MHVRGDVNSRVRVTYERLDLPVLTCNGTPNTQSHGMLHRILFRCCFIHKFIYGLLDYVQNFNNDALDEFSKVK